MAATNRPFLVEQVTGGVETTVPSHLVMPPRWRTSHNMRQDPTLQQVERKKVYATLAAEGNILALPIVPNQILPGYGRVLVLTANKLMWLDHRVLNGSLATDSNYRRWSTVLYNGAVYYTNDLNPVRMTDGVSDVPIAGAPSGRYVDVWYDHLIVGAPTFKGSYYPDQVRWSHLYDFGLWDPDAPNEADFYDVVEWQRPDYPYTGVTGMARIGGTMWIYTPTAIIPLRYVGLGAGRNVIQAVDDQVLTRIGNTYPWTLVPLDRVHFFYDGIEQNFFAFDGQNPVPIGEPIRGYLSANISTDPNLANKMWGTVDVAKREIWWRFVSTASNGAYDKAVVFNYRLKSWFTASTENIQAFSGSVFPVDPVSALPGPVSGLSGMVRYLGTGAPAIPRNYGGASGVIYRDEIPADATADLLTSDDPTLESGDFLYGSLHAQKEARAMAVNAAWDVVRDPTMSLEVDVNARDYLDDAVDWTDAKNVAGNWSRDLEEGRLTHQARAGRVMRYRFLARNARNLRFTAYEPTVYTKGADQ